MIYLAVLDSENSVHCSEFKTWLNLITRLGYLEEIITVTEVYVTEDWQKHLDKVGEWCNK